MKLNRYNLGFKWFGPLEQCDDGKFVLADEVAKHTRLAEYFRDLYCTEMDRRYKAENALESWRVAALILLAIAGVELAMLGGWGA